MMHEDESDSEAVAFDGFITTDADHKGKDESSSIAAPQHARVLELAKAATDLTLKKSSSVTSLTGSDYSWGQGAHADEAMRWAVCIVVVTFDLELGQAIEHIYPPSCPLTDAEKKAICFLAFPDANSDALGDSVFCFRTPLATPSSPSRSTSPRPSQSQQLAPPQQPANGRSPKPSPRAAKRHQPRHCYGSVFFRQVKDDTIRRGYFQKSVVALSRLPYFGLLGRMVRTIAPNFFDIGPQVLEAAWKDLKKWPAPHTGLLELPLLGQLIRVEMPDRSDSRTDYLRSAAFTRKDTPDGTVPAMRICDIAGPYRGLVDNLWLLWELVLTAQPILVISNSPASCSEAVLALVSLIAPLRYAGNYRPFFTIHDPVFREYAKAGQTPPPAIVGVTNPYFNNAFSHWPHIVRLLDPNQNSLLPGAKSTRPGGDSSNPLARLNLKSSPSKLSQKPGVYSEHRPAIEKDKAVLKRYGELQSAMPASGAKHVQSLSRTQHFCTSSSDIGREDVLLSSDTHVAIELVEKQNDALRQHFYQLTQSFMNPFEQYFATLLPLQRQIVPWKTIPRLKPFSKKAFLASLPETFRSLPLSRRGDGHQLYMSFIESPNFDAWLKEKVRHGTRRIKTLYIEQLMLLDVAAWTREHSEVEAVDFLLRLRDMLVSRSELLTPPVIARLEEHISSIVSHLPEDLRNSLHTT